MKIKTTKKQLVEEVKTFCDLCKEEIGFFDDNNVDIEYVETARFPEDDSHRYLVDICDECFINKIYPILKTNGVVLKDSDGDEL